MPTSIVRTSVPDVVEALELSIGSGDPGFTRTELQVPQDSLALAITATDAGPDGHTRGPRDVHVVVRNPAGDDTNGETNGQYEQTRYDVLSEGPLPNQPTAPEQQPEAYHNDGPNNCEERQQSRKWD